MLLIYHGNFKLNVVCNPVFLFLPNTALTSCYFKQSAGNVGHLIITSRYSVLSLLMYYLKASSKKSVSKVRPRSAILKFYLHFFFSITVLNWSCYLAQWSPQTISLYHSDFIVNDCQHSKENWKFNFDKSHKGPDFSWLTLAVLKINWNSHLI